MSMLGQSVKLLQIQGVPKKGIDKKLLFGAAHDFNSQFLNLFGFCISVSLVGVSFKRFGHI